MTSHSKFSIHSAGVSEVHEVPMNIIIRPFPSPLDEDKVQSLMASITVCCWWWPVMLVA